MFRANRRISHSLAAMHQVRELFQPVPLAEMMRITEIWVETALQLGGKALGTMERLCALRSDGDNTREYCQSLQKNSSQSRLVLTPFRLGRSRLAVAALTMPRRLANQLWDIFVVGQMMRAISTLRASDTGRPCAPEKQGLIVVMHATQNIFGRSDKSAIKQICLFIFALSFAACVSVSTGPHLEPAGVSKIKTGVTTAAELELWFGKPYERKALSGGGEQINWQYTERYSGGRGIGRHWLFVTTRSDGKVKSIGESWYYGKG